MTISSALNAGVAGLNVHSSRLATISDNIANSATDGYKRSDVDFSSLVVGQQPSLYTAGGVRAQAYKDVLSSGSLVSTGNSTDLAITGGGMIPVTDFTGVDAPPASRKFMMVPTGSFLPDENGFLTTRSGLFLMGWPTDSSGDASNPSRTSVEALEPVNINSGRFSAEPTQNISLGLNIPAEGVSPTEPYVLPIEYFDNLGVSQQLELTFTPTGTANEWDVSIIDAATSPTVPVGEFTMAFNATTNGGSIATVTDGPGAAYSNTTGNVEFTVAGGATISAFIGIPDEITNGITQLGSNFVPYQVEKDGSTVGDLQSVEVTEGGIVEAIYSTGARRALYQIPAADVPNANGLNAINNQAFTTSSTSGDIYLWDAGTGPTGGYSSFALMESNTNIAGELTALIETQRAYSSNAKVIQTVDEMLQETTNIKR